MVALLVAFEELFLSKVILALASGFLPFSFELASSFFAGFHALLKGVVVALLFG